MGSIPVYLQRENKDVMMTLPFGTLCDLQIPHPLHSLPPLVVVGTDLKISILLQAYTLIPLSQPNPLAISHLSSFHPSIPLSSQLESCLSRWVTEFLTWPVD